MSGSTPDCPPTGSRRWLVTASRYVLAAVLLMAGSSKAVRLGEFIDRLALLGVAYPAARVAGSFVPWLELTLGGCLFLGIMRREAATLAAGSLVVFTAFLLVKADAGDCDCLVVPGLPGVSRVGRGWLLLRNGGLFALAVLVATRTETTRPGSDSRAASGSSPVP